MIADIGGIALGCADDARHLQALISHEGAVQSESRLKHFAYSEVLYVSHYRGSALMLIWRGSHTAVPVLAALTVSARNTTTCAPYMSVGLRHFDLC